MIAVIFFLTFAFQSHAVDIQSFHNTILEAGGNLCGLHIEISGSFLTLKNILPNSVSKSLKKKKCPRRWRVCNGRAYRFECEETGTCYRFYQSSIISTRNFFPGDLDLHLIQQPTKRETIHLSESGSLLFPARHKNFVRITEAQQYTICNKRTKSVFDLPVQEN